MSAADPHIGPCEVVVVVVAVVVMMMAMKRNIPDAAAVEAMERSRPNAAAAAVERDTPCAARRRVVPRYSTFVCLDCIARSVGMGVRGCRTERNQGGGETKGSDRFH